MASAEPIHLSIVMRLLRTVAAAVALSATTAGADAPLPPPFTADLALKASGATIASTRWVLSRDDGGTYTYESTTEPRGLYALLRSDRIVERSEWRFEDGWLQPRHYLYQRTGGKRDREIRIAFDWERNEARHISPKGNWKMSVPHGTLDKLNYLVALMRDLASGRPELVYDIADGGRLKRYRLERKGIARIDTALGTLQAVKVRRLREGSDRQTTLWCAERFDYLPVRVEHREKDGTTITLEIESLEGFSEN